MDDLARLYKDYRGNEYQISRQRFEPWYTPTFNAGLESTSLLARRRSEVSRILTSHLAFQARAILDFGGNRGELISALMPESRSYVFDISGKPPLSTVTRLSALDPVGSEDFDLIVCSNVLEHVSDPLAVLGEMKRSAPHAAVFVEVPVENPLSAGAISKRIVQQILLCLRRPSLAFKLFQLGFILQMHEHVSFYTEKALQCAVERAGYRLVHSGIYRLVGASIGPLRWRNIVAWSIAFPK